MKLAGNVTEYGVMTVSGEVRMRSGMSRGAHDIGWILPMARIQEELGMEARWKCDGSAVLLCPDGKEVQLVKDQGLQFIKWEDFQPIRATLQKSHLKKRPGATPSPTQSSHTVVHCKNI